MPKYVIVGNGVAGHRGALELRRLSPDASIVLIGADLDLPYDRPSLTKDFLLGRKADCELLLKEAVNYQDQGITYLGGTLAKAIDADERRLATSAGEFNYDALLLATGSRPRQLPASLDAGRGYFLRTLDDARRLSSVLLPGVRLAVVGGGFIGLEVAAAARNRGCAVTVIETQSRVLARGLPPLAGHFMAEMHARNGVRILCSQSVSSIDWTDSGARLQLAELTLDADIVVYGLGVEPNVELAQAIGLEVNDGIVVDAACRTSVANVFAAGEVTNHPSGRVGRRRRIESWRLSSEQPLVAAANMAGGHSLYNDVAWLWSDQFDINLQSLGDVTDAATYLIRGSIEDRKWTLIALDADGLPTGAVAINNGRDISMLRRVLNTGMPLPTALAADARPYLGTDAPSTVSTMMAT